MTTTTWDAYADYLDECGEEVDFGEGFFICPDCGEPIYRDDYPIFKIIENEEETMFGVPCPICGFTDWGYRNV